MISVITAWVLAVSVMNTSVATTLVMEISVIAVLPILDGSGHCISDCCFGDDHVGGDDVGDV